MNSRVYDAYASFNQHQTLHYQGAFQNTLPVILTVHCGSRLSTVSLRKSQYPILTTKKITFAYMSTMYQKVALHNVRFFAYHGFYPVEQVLGSEFIVDIEAEFEVFGNGNDDLAQTVDYEKLYAIATAEMNNTRKLIETVAHGLLERIRHEFLAIKNIRVAIRKMHPPMQGEVGSSLVELKFSR